mgnify:CR=1 FL=1
MAELKALSVLIAPEGQLSGDGQLLESFRERRDRRGDDYPMWYLTPSLVEKFSLPSADKSSEAVVAEDPKAIAWLKLRFGGEKFVIEIDSELLKEIAIGYPPSPELRDLRIKKN